MGEDDCAEVICPLQVMLEDCYWKKERMGPDAMRSFDVLGDLGGWMVLHNS
jgi:hypothetical protein